MQAGYDVFFFEDIAGIRPDPSGYGFKVIRFDPLMKDYLPWAKASLESPYGTIVSDWKREDGTFGWTIEIPPNSTGLVALPDGGQLTVNNKPLDEKVFPAAGKTGNKTLFHFPSGRFNIRISDL